MKPQLGQGFLQPRILGGTANPHRKQVPVRCFLFGVADGAGEEGVGAAFLSDGGFWSMA
jgi:hypothetical protein